MRSPSEIIGVRVDVGKDFVGQRFLLSVRRRGGAIRNLCPANPRQRFWGKDFAAGKKWPHDIICESATQHV